MRWLPFAAIAALSLGCGSVVETAHLTGTGGASTTSSAPGTGGATTLTTSDTFTFSITTDPPPSCDPANAFVIIEDETSTTQLDGGCAPIGFFIYGGGPGAPPPHPGPPPTPDAMLQINGCSASSANPVISMNGSASIWPGPTQQARIEYWKNGIDLLSDPGTAQIQLDFVEDVGGYLMGSFSGWLTPVGAAPAPSKVLGKFRVCRTNDVHAV